MLVRNEYFYQSLALWIAIKLFFGGQCNPLDWSRVYTKLNQTYGTSWIVTTPHGVFALGGRYSMSVLSRL